MNESLELRIRHPTGTTQLNTLWENSSIQDLKTEISKMLKVPISSLILKKGFPPRTFDLPPATTLENSEIYSGESIIVEIDPNRVEAKPSTSVASTKQVNGEKTSTKNQKSSQTMPSEQKPNADGMIMIRKIIPADNSCLFNSVAYALENKAKNKAAELREIIAGYIISDPVKYSPPLLEKPNSEYSKWILKETSWGGAIELEILSKHYGVEICAINIVSLSAQLYGENQNYPIRIYLLYDGIHYDVIVRNISEELDLMPDITIFSPDDKAAFEGAMWIAYDLNKKKQFTNLGDFSIECGICYKKFKGEKEAVVHSKETGHANFHEISA